MTKFESKTGQEYPGGHVRLIVSATSDCGRVVYTPRPSRLTGYVQIDGRDFFQGTFWDGERTDETADASLVAIADSLEAEVQAFEAAEWAKRDGQ